MLRHSAEQHSG